MWVFVGVNLLGVRSGGRVQVVTSLLKVVPLILVTVVGAVSILSSPGDYLSNLPTNPITLHASMGAAAVALYTMLGFESAAVAASRVTNPEKTIPRATLIGILFVGIVYVAAVTIGILVVPQATLATSDAPFVTILDHLISPGNGRWLSLFIVISGLGCLNGWTLLSAELTRTLAMHRLLPEVLGESNRYGVPWASLLLAGALATAVGLMNYTSSLVGAFTKLSLIVSAANLPLYVCCSLALFYLLRKSPAGLSPALWLAASVASPSQRSRSSASAGSRSSGRWPCAPPACRSISTCAAGTRRRCGRLGSRVDLSATGPSLRAQGVLPRGRDCAPGASARRRRSRRCATGG
jgi:APA family basic amino acid/polyamine antiporter